MFSMLFVFWLLLFNRLLFVQAASLNETALQDEPTSNDNSLTLTEDVTAAAAVTLAPTESSINVDTPTSPTDDVIELNVGGEKITTLRSTLTAVPESKLARMFSKDNTENSLTTDRQGAVFFDYNPVYFNFLLDQLRTIKRQPKRSLEQLEFRAPYMGSHVNFTHMLIDLGLTRNFYSKPCNTQIETIKDNKSLIDYLLSPREGAHINLSVSSLTGWKECYRNAYNIPFNLSTLKKTCNGSRILVACRPVGNNNTLTLAGIGDMEDVLHPCLPKQCKFNETSKKNNKKLVCSGGHQCITQAKRGVGWYNANNQTWGFVRGSLSFMVNPCDSSTLDSDYRLCWTSHTAKKQGSGDRCGSALGLQNSTKWERLIYYTI